MKLLSVEEIFICCANWGAHAEYAYCHGYQTCAQQPASYGSREGEKRTLVPHARATRVAATTETIRFDLLGEAAAMAKRDGKGEDTGGRPVWNSSHRNMRGRVAVAGRLVFVVRWPGWWCSG